MAYGLVASGSFLGSGFAGVPYTLSYEFIHADNSPSGGLSGSIIGSVKHVLYNQNSGIIEWPSGTFDNDSIIWKILPSGGPTGWYGSGYLNLPFDGRYSHVKMTVKTSGLDYSEDECAYDRDAWLKGGA